MTTYWLQLTPAARPTSTDRLRRLSWRVLDEQGSPVARGGREFLSYSAAIEDARLALRELRGQHDHPWA